MDFDGRSSGKSPGAALAGAFLASVVAFALLAGKADAELITPNAATPPPITTPVPAAPVAPSGPSSDSPGDGSGAPSAATIDPAGQGTGSADSSNTASVENMQSRAQVVDPAPNWRQMSDAELNAYEQTLNPFTKALLYADILTSGSAYAEVLRVEISQADQPTGDGPLAEVLGPIMDIFQANGEGGQSSGAPVAGDPSGDSSSGPDAGTPGSGEAGSDGGGSSGTTGCSKEPGPDGRPAICLD